MCGALVTSVSAQKNGMSCRLGFSYEISSNNNWGKDKPVIMKVYPNSPAEVAGIKQNDIIEKIDGLSVTEISLDDVDSLLTATENSRISLTLCNFSDPARTVSVTKECYSNNALNENQLATAFAMYSVEDTHERLFICPFITTTTEEPVDFSQFRTYSFTEVEDTRISKIETTVNETLRSELSKKGLQFDAANPDFLIQTYYTFDKNPNFKRKSKATAEELPVYRYDITRDKITKFPFYSSSTPESESEYILQFGLRFIDQRHVPGRVLWECEANELMNGPYSIAEYATIHIPLMCMQFPYVKYTRNVQYILAKKKYNYTGINYSIYQLNEIVSIDENSPAYKAGIMPHDIIDRIEEKRMDYTSEEFTAAYRAFIAKTLKYRDKKTLFTDANGFPNCMYWDTFKYIQIAKLFNDKKYMTAFSYLYNFEPYVNPSKNSSCTFYIRRGSEKLQFTLRPTLYSEKTIELN
jgi:hypothetical protein